MAKKVLLIVHHEHSDPGRVADKLAGLGFELDLRRLSSGEGLPDSLAEHAGAVSFGGPMSANDDDVLPFIRDELEWLSVPLRENKPFLGICLGAQLLARHLGASVAPHAAGWHEIGYHRVRASQAGEGLFAPEQHFYQWHNEGFGLPAKAELLASAEHFPNQAFRYGSALGIQFHPEVTRAMMERWTTGLVHRMCLPGAHPREAHMSGHDRHDGAVERWLDGFLRHWLGLEHPDIADAAD